MRAVEGMTVGPRSPVAHPSSSAPSNARPVDERQGIPRETKKHRVGRRRARGAIQNDGVTGGNHLLTRGTGIQGDRTGKTVGRGCMSGRVDWAMHSGGSVQRKADETACGRTYQNSMKYL